MLGRFKVIVFISFIVLLIFTSASEALAQKQILNKKISGSFSNITLVSALRKIALQNNVKFSYNPEIIKANKLITLRYDNLSIEEVLKLLINDPTVSYREIGNQIVMYRAGEIPSKVEVTQVVSPEKVVPKPRMPNDTVFVYRIDTILLNRIDTVFRSITITKFDTIRIYDTVFRDKIKTQKPAPTKQNTFAKNSMRHKKFKRNNGYYSSFYVGWLPGKSDFQSSDTSDYLSRIQSAVSASSSSFETGFMLGYDYYKIGLRTGIGLTRLSEHFSYAFLDEKGGFFKKDTVEKYYLEPIGTDTTWIYIYDSTWIPKEVTEHNYKNLNTYHYITIPLSVKFRFLQSDVFDLYALGGVNTQLLVRSKALYMLPDEQHSAGWIARTNLNPVVFSYHAGLGASLKLNDDAGIFTDVVYRSQISDLYVDLPASKHFRLLDIKVGAFLKF